MAHHVPDFEMDHSSPRRGNKTLVGDEDIMELLWQNGQVVAQNQNHRLHKKPTNAGEAEFTPPRQSFNGREIPSVNAEIFSRQLNQKNQNPHQHQHQQLFIQEDEMTSWLQYQLEDYSLDREIYSDIFYPSISAPATPQRDTRSSLMEVRRQPLLPPPVPVAPSTFIAPRPCPIAHPPRCADVEMPASNFQNLFKFSRIPRASVVESAPSSSNKEAGEFTRAESNETPTAGQNSSFSLAIGSSAQPSNGNVGTSAVSTSTAGRGFTTTCDLTVTASPGGSGGSVIASVDATPAIDKPALCTVEERKRKERESDIDGDCHSEEQDDEFVSTEVQKQSRKCTLIKRSRASEVHNLSERKRRDRINDRMRALQELIPRCNKVDKASMLDEAIEYLKSLQLQVQMMSMGCGMVPMMYPGAQQYMPAMGMGMGMGMNHPMMTYPAQFTGSGFPLQAAAANLAPRFSMPVVPMQQIPVSDTARNPTSIQPHPMLHSLIAQGSNQVRMSTPVVDSYQHLVGLQQAQVQVQSQVEVHHSSSRDTGNLKNKKTG